MPPKKKKPEGMGTRPAFLCLIEQERLCRYGLPSTLFYQTFGSGMYLWNKRGRNNPLSWFFSDFKQNIHMKLEKDYGDERRASVFIH